MAIATPCNKICVIEAASQLCIGCGRSLNEIARWAALGDDGREQVMAELPERLTRLARLRPAAIERS
jgi:predicted Fe-S protein YdhL (DUF1289 family)